MEIMSRTFTTELTVEEASFLCGLIGEKLPELTDDYIDAVQADLENWSDYYARKSSVLSELLRRLTVDTSRMLIASDTYKH